MTLNGTTYYYVTNLQGDVIALTDSSGNIVVEYVYDSWGKLISTTGSLADTVGVKNPYRYRSYRYDTETGLYYLQSRYYNPEIKRFINADVYVDTGNGTLSTNMFAYCENDSINRIDQNGNVSKKILSTFKKSLRFFRKIIDSPLFTILLDIGLLIAGFTPAGMVLKAAIILGYIGRAAIAIRSIRKACKTLKKNPKNADAAYTKVFGYITIVSCLFGIIATITSAPKGTILKSVGRITIDAISKVLGTATSGYMILADITNYILKGCKPNRKKCVTYA